MGYTTLISASNLAENINQNNWIIFDCRFSLIDPEAGFNAYRQGHIPGARYANLNNDLSSPVLSYTGRHPLPNFKKLATQLGLWGVSNRSQVIVYDDNSGAIAGRFWWLLRTMGHQNVALLDGGINHWQKLKLPLTTKLPKILPNQFRAYVDDHAWLSANNLENNLANNQITLVDARSAERFSGQLEKIDAIAGHIPKALNRPFNLNLNQHGLFLSPEVLKIEFKQLLGSRSVDKVIHMCGSGVTACHNLLAMEYAGLQGSKLFAGSWSEWIVNPNRAVSQK